jgi:hypothetical protein
MSFYFAPTYKRVIGTSPYILQESSVERETHVESQQPQSGAVVMEEEQFHDRDNLPNLKVNLNQIKVRATQDILDELDSKVSKLKRT